MIGSEDLQRVVLLLLSERPRHGYDLIKALEERSSGLYTPSPGVIYPALTYLEEAGFATSEPEGNKKLFHITEAGKAHLQGHREDAEETLEQLARVGRRMARVQQHLADEEAENDFAEGDPRVQARAEWRELKKELRDLRDELRSALREKMSASFDEKRRVLAILRTAIQDIRGA